MNIFNRAKIVVIKDGEKVKPLDLDKDKNASLIDAYKALKLPLVQRNYIDDPGVITLNQSASEISMEFTGFTPQTTAFLIVAFSDYVKRK